MRSLTRDEAIEMYAQFLTTHHGAGAAKVARNKAQALAQCGDTDGVTVWTKLADVIESNTPRKKKTRH
jgi:hypothetical protein